MRFKDYWTLPKDKRWMPAGPEILGGRDADVTQLVYSVRDRLRELGISVGVSTARLMTLAQEFEDEWEKVINEVSREIRDQ